MGELLIMYLASVLISKGIDTYNVLLRMKDLTDAGYKLRNDKIMEDMHKEIRIKNDYWYVPFYNIYDSLLGYFDYVNNDKSTLLYQEYQADRVEELNPREKRKYEESPTMLNAYLLEYKMENIRNKSSKINLSDGSVLYYTMDAEEGIKFVDCVGPSQYRDERQLTTYLIDGYDLILDEYLEQLENNNLSEDELQEKINQINEVKEYLNKAREKLSDINDSKTLVKKI